MNSISLPKKTNKKFMVLSAIGIIMVVDLHSNFALNLFNSSVPYTSFFMPMFVFISGYFNKVDDKTDLKAYVRKKIRSLLVPYIAIVFATFWLQWALNCIKFGTLQPITIDDIIEENPSVFDMNNLVCVSLTSHKAIHYGNDKSMLGYGFVDRKPNDTCPWREVQNYGQYFKHDKENVGY